MKSALPLPLTSIRSRLLLSCFPCLLILLSFLLNVPSLNAQVPQHPPAALFLSVKDGRLTVNIDHASLGEVLAELGRQAHLRIALPESGGSR